LLRLFRNESFSRNFCKIISLKTFWEKKFLWESHEREKNFAHKNLSALKWCKVGKSVEDGRVSLLVSLDFHKLINTCVENLMEEKYFFENSASRVLFRVPF